MYILCRSIQIKLDRSVLFGTITALVIIHVNMSQACTPALLGSCKQAFIRRWWNIHQPVRREKPGDMPGAVSTQIIAHPAGDRIMLLRIIIFSRDDIGSCLDMHAQLVCGLDGMQHLLYRGRTAELLVDQMGRSNGLITAEDLESYSAEWRDPPRADWRQYEILSGPSDNSCTASARKARMTAAYGMFR